MENLNSCNVRFCVNRDFLFATTCQKFFFKSHVLEVKLHCLFGHMVVPYRENNTQFEHYVIKITQQITQLFLINNSVSKVYQCCQ